MLSTGLSSVKIGSLWSMFLDKHAFITAYPLWFRLFPVQHLLLLPYI
ncbi:hypothetical protein [Paenibacillus sp. JGP012]|nr:hypothetical protein [Paenibacillus sp. JGP012]